MKKLYISLGVVAILLIGIIISLFIPTGFVVSGASMEPTYAPGTKLSTSPDISNIQRGQVVIFNYIQANGQTVELIKRVVGLPRESVAIKNGQLFINNVLTNVTPITLIENESAESTTPIPTNMAVVNLGSDEYFVLGDNTVLSDDSRYIGSIKKVNIIDVVTGVK